jgi:hypothetical protein
MRTHWQWGLALRYQGHLTPPSLILIADTSRSSLLASLIQHSWQPGTVAVAGAWGPRVPGRKQNHEPRTTNNETPGLGCASGRRARPPPVGPKIPCYPRRRRPRASLPFGVFFYLQQVWNTRVEDFFPAAVAEMPWMTEFWAIRIIQVTETSVPACPPGSISRLFCAGDRRSPSLLGRLAAHAERSSPAESDRQRPGASWRSQPADFEDVDTD